jgi:hypothetical protein
MAPRESPTSCASRLGRIHPASASARSYRGVGRHIGWPVGLAIAAGIKSDAAEALFAEIGQLRLVDARVDDRPGRQGHHRFRAVAVDLVVDLHAIALDKTALAGQFCASHHLFDEPASALRTRSADPPQSLAYRRAFLSKPSK